MNLTEYYRFRIKESKFPDMLDENRFWGSNMGLTQECLDEGLADEPLDEIGLVRDDVEVVPDHTMINEVCRQYLKDTDWYEIRAISGKPVPEDILQKRQEARDSVMEA